MCLGMHCRQQAPGPKAVELSLIGDAAFKAVTQEHPTKPQHRSKYPRRSHAHIIVHHNYHDHGRDLDTVHPSDEQHPARGGVTTPFPLTLHAMLDGVKRAGLEEVVAWQPHGRCFVVHKPKEFVELLPRFFKLSKLASFQRQLNLYGFARITTGPDRGGYYHELFLRNKVFLAHQIQRLKVKGTGVRARANPAEEPDFWKMEWMDEDDNIRGTAPLLDERHHTPKTKVPDAPVAPSTLACPSSLVVSGNPPGPITMLTSTVVPIVSPVRVRQSKFVPGPHSNAVHDNDVVCAFDKTFHYLDPLQPLPIPDSKVQSASNNPPTAPTVLSSPAEVEDEAETFFKDFEFPDIGPDIEDDAVFGEMLASLIG